MNFIEITISRQNIMYSMVVKQNAKSDNLDLWQSRSESEMIIGKDNETKKIKSTPYLSLRLSKMR